MRCCNGKPGSVLRAAESGPQAWVFSLYPQASSHFLLELNDLSSVTSGLQGSPAPAASPFPAEYRTTRSLSTLQNALLLCLAE